MNVPSVHSHASPLRAASGFSALGIAFGSAFASAFGSAPGRTLARLLLLALLPATLLAYCNVLQASVQRGEQLNRQMADAASRCDGAAARQRPLTCIRPADADASHSGPVARQQLAAR